MARKPLSEIVDETEETLPEEVTNEFADEKPKISAGAVVFEEDPVENTAPAEDPAERLAQVTPTIRSRIEAELEAGRKALENRV